MLHLTIASSRFVARLVPMVGLLLLPALAGAQSNRHGELQAAVRNYRSAHEGQIVRELVDLLSLQNIASSESDIRRNAAHLLGLLERRGFSVRLLESTESPPAVLGTLNVPGATRTVMLYAHYDGQPAAAANWETPPWEPALRDGPIETGGTVIEIPESGFEPEWRVYARSASDDKAPIVAALTALDALEAVGTTPSVNIKVFLEGEEEAGSPHLRDMLTRHADALAADVWLFMDGPVHQSRRPQVVYGVRGVVGLQMTVYGPTSVLHSGHYGNWAPNPAVMLVRLISSMRDDEGRILIDGFYDDVRPISAAERRAIDRSPEVEAALARALSLGRTEGGGRLLEQIALPALNLQGLRAGNVGALARNAVPTEATAAFDFRLVPDQRPERVRRLVEEHIRRQGYTIIADAPSDDVRAANARLVKITWGTGYPAQRTRMDIPVARAVADIVDSATDEDLVLVPGLGGSLPLYLFEEVLARPLIIVPMVNHDNNQHAPNENLRLQNLWDGIEMYAVLLAQLGVVWAPTP